MDIKEAGRLGGLARAKKLSKKKRSESARKAAQARWSKLSGARLIRKILSGE